jgi:hypothetical protein
MKHLNTPARLQTRHIPRPQTPPLLLLTIPRVLRRRQVQCRRLMPRQVHLDIGIDLLS